jgi:hypothetical protein
LEHIIFSKNGYISLINNLWAWLTQIYNFLIPYFTTIFTFLLLTFII